MGSGSGDPAFSDRQFIVITSEKQARVVALPSQNCVYRQQIVDADFIVKAEIVSMKGLYRHSKSYELFYLNFTLIFQIAYVSFAMPPTDTC